MARVKVDPEKVASLDGCYWLTNGMARSVGVNLPDAVAQGAIDRHRISEMVAQCRSCTKTEACLLYLAQGEGHGDDVPSYCLNHEAIEALKWRR